MKFHTNELFDFDNIPDQMPETEQENQDQASEEPVYEHAGHRERLRARYVNGGAGALSDCELLELALFYALPRKDTAPLAQSLLKQFGSLAGILNTPRGQLTTLYGVSEQSALFLSVLADISRRATDTASGTPVFDSKNKIGRHISTMLAGQVTESTVLLCFDSENRLLLADTVFNGNLKNYTDAHIRKILDCAISVGSSLIALGHNHPIGSLSPSENDIATTRALEFTLKNVGVSLVDGFVVNDSDWIAILDYANTLEETEL